MAIFISCSTVFGQNGVINGNVYDRRGNRGLAFVNVWLVGTKIGAATDNWGDFKIDSVPFGIYDLKASLVGYGDTTIKSIKISTDTILTVKIVLPPPCEYDKRRNNMTCPICSKKDQVVPILYGLPIGKLHQKKFYYAGCIITFCDPNWYCKRDKHKF